MKQKGSIGLQNQILIFRHQARLAFKFVRSLLYLKKSAGLQHGDRMKRVFTAEATLLPSHRIWWTAEMDRGDIKSGRRIWPGCRWGLSERVGGGGGAGRWRRGWTEGGGDVRGGGGGTGWAAVCRWWLAGAPQLGLPPAWPPGALLWIQSFVLPCVGQTNSCLIILWDSQRYRIMTQLQFQLCRLCCKICSSKHSDLAWFRHGESTWNERTHKQHFYPLLRSRQTKMWHWRNLNQFIAAPFGSLILTNLYFSDRAVTYYLQCCQNKLLS